MKTVRKTFEEYYMPCKESSRNRKGFKITYQYVGSWYSFRVEKKTLRRCKCLMGILCVCATLCFFAAALQESEVNCAAAPTICAMLSLAALLFEWTGIVWFCVAGEKMTEYSFHEMHLMLKTAAPVHALLSFCAAAAGVFVEFAESISLRALPVPVLFFFSGMFSFGIFRMYGKLQFDRLENKGFSSVSCQEDDMSKMTNCNQCHNACRLDEVKCGRGEKYREYLQNGGDPESYVPEKRKEHGGRGRGGRGRNHN